jgi:branched-chain amino acid transport system substrate-binding protein
VFGVPAKAAAELLIDEMNAAGGIGGVKISATFIDEGVGGDKLLSEYRRLVQEQGVRTMLSAISSGNCNIIAPVAEDLKVLNVMWDCGTEKVLESRRYKYVVRTQANATTESDVTVVAEMFPKLGASDFSTEISRLQALKPDEGLPRAGRVLHRQDRGAVPRAMNIHPSGSTA